MVTKAGKKTYGVDRLFSSWYGKPVPGLAVLAWSLIRLQERRSSPRRVAPRLRPAAEKAAPHRKARKRLSPPKHTAPKGRPGRPPGRKHGEKTPIVLSPELPRIHPMLQQQWSAINGLIPLSDTVWDGHFGHHLALHRVRGVG